MTDTIKRYIKYFRGMSLIETLFASAVLSVVVVSGLTVTSDAIKSRAKQETRIAMLTEGVSTVEKARHEKDTSPALRTLVRERLKDGNDYRTLQAKIEDNEVTAAAIYDNVGDDQKILLRSAFAGKNEALSTFFTTTFQCEPFIHTPATSSSGEGSSKGSKSGKSSKSKSSKGKSKGNSKACSRVTSKAKASKAKSNVCGESSTDPWDGHVAVTVIDLPSDDRDAFTVSVSDCTPSSEAFDVDDRPASNADAPTFTCSREDIAESSWQPTITVNGFFSNPSIQNGICVAEGQADRPRWTTSCALNSDKNAASIRLVLRNNEDYCKADSTGRFGQSDTPTNVSFPSTSSDDSGGTSGSNSSNSNSSNSNSSSSNSNSSNSNSSSS